MTYKVNKSTKHKQKTHTSRQKEVSEQELHEWASFLYNRYIAPKRKEQNGTIRQKSR